MNKLKLKEEKEKQKIKEIVKRMEYEKHKRGITKQKEDYEKVKARRYVRQMNEMYSIINPEKHIEITEGTKKEGEKHCNTKSQWKYKREELEKEGKVKPEIVEVKENMPENREEKKIKNIKEDKEEKVMLLNGEKIYLKNVKIINRIDNIYTMKFKIGRKDRKIKAQKVLLENEKIYETKFGNITGKMLMKIMLTERVEIYEIVI